MFMRVHKHDFMVGATRAEEGRSQSTWWPNVQWNRWTRCLESRPVWGRSGCVNGGKNICAFASLAALRRHSAVLHTHKHTPRDWDLDANSFWRRLLLLRQLRLCEANSRRRRSAQK